MSRSNGVNEGTELGRFLRARRARIGPEEAGLPTGTGTRRTPGLRREELATLAGVSVDYYTRLERGRESRPSPPVIEALGSALQLSGEALERLRDLAQLAARHGGARLPVERSVRPSVIQLLENLRPGPAYVISRTNDILAFNRGGLRLLPGIEEWPARRRNVTRYMFLHPQGRTLFANWEEMVGHSVAHLRAAAGADPDQPELASLVGELLMKSSEFARVWERYEVQSRGGGVKHYRHPDVGSMVLTYEVMALARTDGQRLVAYQATPGSRDYDAMLLLDMADPKDADKSHPAGC
ncbi:MULTISPECIES: helix-turn-helix transcriptional regulator [unclassified Streptomyces]|uniref:helix-turn-helix transcriptional regulator n=1 Tax=unclassified Streptomyces TaxID=2593676 RepID=UPI002DDA7F98|nr:helix-turn-helix transcriptional regulator [Streptomyces sp. NBC_01775]WSB79831.1 helix-turn-helix transcriptional regulator [Streptomyces sp. NBC_01775]WSS40676.1 helix-turn-helix transcriptional regulator [Streptomyces sp. NBC_01187]